MYNFCTLFDSNYLSRGLSMYESLNSVCHNYHLFIFAFDENCYQVLDSLKLINVTLISTSDFEDEELISLKSTRTSQEYCWTCTPSIILYVITKYKVKNCTYIDADLFFYKSPEILIQEAEDNSIIITKHRYTPRYDQSVTRGKYCVQFVYFKNDNNGLLALNWWKEQCNKWCFNRVEENRFGDQKYLDDWPERFSGVHELKHLGGGVAPWNIQQYKLIECKNKITFEERISAIPFDLIFYHYHNVSFYDKYIDLGRYILNKKIINVLYKPYINKLNKYNFNIMKEFSHLRINSNSVKKLNKNQWQILKYRLSRYLNGTDNFLKTN